MIQGLHHVALRVQNAAQSIRFYRDVLGLNLTAAVGDDFVGSTREFSPHLNMFFQMPDGGMIDLIEVPLSAAEQKDENTPAWVKHLALRVGSMEELLEMKQRLVEAGADVIGPTDHVFCHSIYFFDPSGHRLELAWDYNPQALAALSGRTQKSVEQWEGKKKTGWPDRQVSQ